MQQQTIQPLWGWFPPPLPPLNFPQANIIDRDEIININNRIGGNPSPVSVTDVTTPTYTALATDYFLCVDTVTNAVTITLPTGILGTVYMVKDCSGNADTNNITIQGTGGQLVDGSVATINVPYGSIQLIFNGTEWSVV
jgi:hypothetical protein